MAKVEKAETELLDMAALNSTTSIPCTIEAFAAVLRASGSPENLKAAANLIIQHFASDTHVVTKLVEVILGQEVPCRSRASLHTPDGNKVLFVVYSVYEGF